MNTSRLEAALKLCHTLGRGGEYKGAMTSAQMKAREERRRNMAAGIRLAGGKVNKDYDSL